MSYKIVACDFDDTLYSNNTHTISAADKEAVAMCEAKGIKFILVTGRPLGSIKPYYLELGLKTPMITTGGAEIYDRNFNRTYSSFLKYDNVMLLLKKAKELGIYAHIYKNGHFIYEKYDPVLEMYIKHTGMSGTECPQLMSLPPEEFETPKLLMIADPDRITEVQKELAEEYPQLNVVKSFNMFVEFYEKTTSKGIALEHLVDQMGFTLDETVAVGDTQIDISMLKIAGLSAAPANSMKDAIAAADIVLKDVDHECIAELLNEYVFDK